MNLRTFFAFLLTVCLTAPWLDAPAASATVLTGDEGGIYDGPIVAESEGSIQLHSAIATVSCSKSTIEASIEEQGESVTASGPVPTLDFSECSSTITEVKPGTLEFHYTSGVNGTV